jgi:hypothetical protein
MTLRSTLSVLVLAVSSLAVGCAAPADSDSEGTPSASSSDLTLAGNVSGGDVATKKFGSITTANGNLHVVAHEIHVRGAKGRTVDVGVNADGSFHLAVARGKRWLVTVDDADGSSAILTFGNGHNVLSVSATGGSSRIDLGGLHVVGGEAQSSIAFDASLGVEATLAGLDDVFEGANGAIIAAREAAEEAREAADEARKAAGDALASAEEARKAAEEALDAAGR